MKHRLYSKMWFRVSLTIFLIMLITLSIMATGLMLVMHMDPGQPVKKIPLVSAVILLLISMIFGSATSLVCAKSFLEPIIRFSDAAREVAKGNFAVRLGENEAVDEIREFAHNFNTMLRALSNTEILRNDFIVNVSHEFKTPIAAIEGYATLLTDGSLSESERAEYAQMILESAKQLSSMSGNILTLSKLENQEALLERKPFRLDEQLRQAVLMLESEWSAKRLDMQIELEKVTYNGSESLLMQVWMNMIGNAIKFTPDSGRVEIRLNRTESGALVEISDTGCGMDETVRRHIWGKFYQGDTSHKSEGNGLGLALVKRILELFGGGVTVKSTVGAGSTFAVTLPKGDL
jgi:signal transduction histidine kinase